MISHKTYFDTVINEVAAAGKGLTAMIVSDDGLVLDSNTEDAHAEAQLAALASIYLEFGQRMMDVPGFTEAASGTEAPMLINLSVSPARFIILTRLSETLVLIVTAENKSLIAEAMKRSLGQAERLTAMVRNQEILL